MVTKNKTGEKKGKVKVGKLKLNKETVRDLSAAEQEKVKGGIVRIPTNRCSITCISVCKKCEEI